MPQTNRNDAIRIAVAALSSDYWGKVASPPKSRLENAAAAAKSEIDQVDSSA